MMFKCRVVSNYMGIIPGVIARRDDGAIAVGDDETPAVWLPAPAGDILDAMEARAICAAPPFPGWQTAPFI